MTVLWPGLVTKQWPRQYCVAHYDVHCVLLVHGADVFVSGNVYRESAVVNSMIFDSLLKAPAL